MLLQKSRHRPIRNDPKFRLETMEERTLPSVFTVTNTDDSGAGSLRQAITDANSAAGADTIAFNIPGNGVHVIQPLTILPSLTGTIVIDGYTQPGSAPNTSGPGVETNALITIQVDGSLALGYGIKGLVIKAGGSTVRGLSIRSFTSNELDLNGGNNVVEGVNIPGAVAFQTGTNNRFGGTAPAQRNVVNGVAFSDNNNVIQGNVCNTVGISSSYNLIGGTTPAERNVIAGGKPGLYISGDYNTVQGNFLGTDITGMQKSAVTTRQAALFIDYTATGNIIGGTTPGTANVISGSERGIYIWGGYGNTIQGNLIGTNATGTAPLGNGDGILITANNNLIGGTTSAARNVIADNGTGVVVNGSGNIVQGNLIGVLADGTTPAGNNTYGVELPGISSHDNLIGGQQPGAGNVIAYTMALPGYPYGAGVVVWGVQGYNPIRNSILGNSIFANQGLGIDITNDQNVAGVTPNDPGDVDTGANSLQNFPVIATATSDATNTNLTGTFDSTPNGTFRVEFFANSAADPSGYGEGGKFLGFTSITTDFAGHADFAVTLPGSTVGQFVTATATSSDSNTSEFSLATKVDGKSLSVPARIESVIINLGAAQRSLVTSLSVTFDQKVTLPANPTDAFRLSRQSDDALVALSAVVSGKTVTVTFVGGPVENGSLSDGKYTLTLLASKINDGNFDGNSDGTAGDNFVIVGNATTNKLFRLFGDANGNGSIDGNDFALFRGWFSLGTSIFDFNNDGQTNATDFAEFRKRFGLMI